MKKTVQIVVKAPHSQPPTVEFDTEVNAAYVRFTKKPVARTVPIETNGPTVTIDYDAENEIVGVELIGVDNFGVAPLLKQAGVQALEPDVLRDVRYVPANLQEA